MKQTGSDVIVIGAGIIGASIAYHLSKRGLSVRIFDGGDSYNASSYGNAGLIAVDHVAPLANLSTLAGVPKMLLQQNGPLRFHKRATLQMVPWIFRFVQASMPHRFHLNVEALASLTTQAGGAWARLVADGVCPALHRDIGSLYVYERPENPGTRRSHLARLDRFNVAYEDLSVAQIRERYLSTLKPTVSHGRFFPDMASVSNPQRVVDHLLAASISAGTNLVRTDVEHVRIVHETGCSVRSNGQDYSSLKVVIAAGNGSQGILARMGIALPLARERGYHVELETPSHDVLGVPVSFSERGFTCNPMDGGIRLAGTVELGGGDKPDWGRANMLALHFGDLFEGPKPVVRSKWKGDRPTLPDYLPVISCLQQTPNIVVATGHQHLGLTLGPLTGELVSGIVLGNAPRIDLTPFRVDRF
jgi:D-hydroxyproline dehydrogenase